MLRLVGMLRFEICWSSVGRKQAAAALCCLICRFYRGRARSRAVASAEFGFSMQLRPRIGNALVVAVQGVPTLSRRRGRGRRAWWCEGRISRCRPLKERDALLLEQGWWLGDKGVGNSWVPEI